MTYATHMHRLGSTAIAAVLALTATPALSQDIVDPFAAPSPTAATGADPLGSNPPPQIDPVPVVSDPVVTPAADDTPAEADAKPTSEASRQTVAAPVSPRIERAASQPAASPADEAAASAEETSVLPAAIPAVEQVPAEQASREMAPWLPIAGASGLALISLIPAAALLRRRKKVEPEAPFTAFVEVRKQAPSQPMAASGGAKPLFNWNRDPAPATAGTRGAHVGDGLPTVEAAYAGPTPDNPFLSLKRRLKRANFFAQRQRLIEEGKAEPLSPYAGLPDRLVAVLRKTGDAFAPARQFQPA